MKPPREEISDEEADRRAADALRRALNTPYKPQRDLIGQTPRAKAMARKRKAKGLLKSAG